MIEQLFTRPDHGSAPQRHHRLWVVAGQGIVGDRYFGHHDEPGQNLTLVEAEVIEAFQALHGRPIDLSVTGRNVVTRGVRLNALLGREFRIGRVRLRGVELCDPCLSLGEALAGPGLTPPEVVRQFVDRGGLRADVLTSGELSLGQPLRSQAEPIALRPARPDDALGLSVLAMQVFLDTYATDGIRPAIAREVLSSYSQAQFDQAIADPFTRLAVAERDGHLIGFAQLTLGAAHALAPAASPCELLRLYVQEPFTGTGVGSQLLAEAERLAAAAGCDRLWLTPWVHNHRARGFYAARGYDDLGLTDFVFEGERHANRVVARWLRAQPTPSGV